MRQKETGADGIVKEKKESGKGTAGKGKMAKVIRRGLEIRTK